MGHKSKTLGKEGNLGSPPAPQAADADALKREIELRAYYRYCERGCAAGADIDDWIAAEQEVLAAHEHSGIPDGKA